MNHSHRAGPPLFAGLAFLAALAACAPNINLGKVQQYALMEQQAQASFDAIADDYDASCARQRELTVRANDLTWKPLILTNTGVDQNAASTPAAPVAGAKPSPTPFFGASQETCTVTAGYSTYPLGAVSNDWKRANDTLLTYIQSLGAVATATSIPTPAVYPLTGAAVNAGLLPAPEATHIATFATAIITYLQKREREEDVVKFIKAVNAKNSTSGATLFGDAIEALTVAGSSYSSLIFNECTEITNLYTPALAALQEPNVQDGIKVERAHRIRLRWSSDLAACSVHQNAASGYLSTLKKISASNDELLKEETTPGSVRNQLFSDILDLSDSVSSLYTLLFSKNPIPTASPKAK